MSTNDKAARYFLPAILISAILWFGFLGQRELFDPDEGRYAGIPAAMVDSGDWITPRLNDFKYFEKPVLQYWATAVAFERFGKSNTTARLWTALLGFATALFTMLLASRLYGRQAARYGFLICISCLVVVVFGHYLTLDMALSGFLVMGLGSLVIAQGNPPESSTARNWMLAGWAALALATLTKGLIGVVLPAATVVIYSIWQRDLKLWKNLHLFKGSILFLLIAAPWFIAVSLKNPEFSRFFFIHEHFERYTSEVHNRAGPLYYFVPLLLVGVCPWLLTSLRSLFKPGFRWLPDDPGVFNAERFMWTFVVVTFCFFSLGSSKLPGYILPIFPLIAVLAAGQIAQDKRVNADRYVMLLLGLILLIASFSAEQFADARYPARMWASYAPWLTGSGALYLLAFVLMSIKKIHRSMAFASAALLSMTAALLIVTGASSLEESRSSRVVADAIAASLPAGAPIFSYLNYPESAVFYLGRPITVVEYEGELAMGIKAEPDKYIRTQDEFIARWQNLEQAAVVVKINRLESLNVDALHGKVVYKGPKYVVIIKS